MAQVFYVTATPRFSFFHSLFCRRLLAASTKRRKGVKLRGENALAALSLEMTGDDIRVVAPTFFVMQSSEYVVCGAERVNSHITVIEKLTLQDRELTPEDHE